MRGYEISKSKIHPVIRKPVFCLLYYPWLGSWWGFRFPIPSAIPVYFLIQSNEKCTGMISGFQQKCWAQHWKISGRDSRYFSESVPVGRLAMHPKRLTVSFWNPNRKGTIKRLMKKRSGNIWKPVTGWKSATRMGRCFRWNPWRRKIRTAGSDQSGKNGFEKQESFRKRTGNGRPKCGRYP